MSADADAGREAAIDSMVGTGDETRLVGGEKARERGNLLGLADTSERVRLTETAKDVVDVCVRAFEGARRQFEDGSADGAGADRDDTNAVRRKIDRHRAGQRMDRALR